MKLSIGIKMALIAATLSSASFAMQPNNTPTFSSEFCTDNAGRIHMLAEYLNPQDKNNLREVSKNTQQFIDLTIQNMVIHEINQTSLTRITNTAAILHALKITSLGLFINQHINFPLFPVLKQLDLSPLDMNLSVEQTKTIIDCCPQLEELNVSGCLDAPDGIIQALTDNPNALQNLKTLNLNDSDISTDKMYTIIQHCPLLQDLKIELCIDAQDGIIQALTENPNALQNLKTIFLKNSVISNENQMHTIIQCCPKLNHLRLRHYSPAAIFQALENNPNALKQLKILDLNNIIILDYQTMYIIAQHCSQLEELNVIDCFNAPKIIIQVLQRNPNALKQLKRLNLEKTKPSVSVEQIDFIQKSLPHVQIDW